MEETEEGIDYSLLKKQETIYFYDDVVLYEDELADNGTAVLSVKIVSLQTWPLPYPGEGFSETDLAVLMCPFLSVKM